MRTFHSELADYVLHSFAYDEYGNYLRIDDAVKISHRKWYLDRECQVELIPVNFKEQKKQISHWKVKANQYLIIQGKKYKYDSKKDSESYHHKQMKGIIISSGFFYIDNYKIFIKDPKEEYRICDSRFEADISCTLLCGTPCIIEVVKTSEISESKREYILENEILTFKIYIDENGNQIFHKSNYFGGGKINSIKKSIQKGEGAVIEIRREYEDANQIAKDKSFKEIFKFSEYLENRKQTNFPILIRTESIGRSIEQQDKINHELSAEIDRLTNEVKLCERYSDEICRLENEIANMEQEIREIIKNCKTEWFTNRSDELVGEQKYQEILYQIS